MNSQNNIVIEGFKMTELGLMPEDWRTTKLGQVADTFSGGTPSREKPEYWRGEIPWLKSGELNDSREPAPSEFITTLGLNNSSAKYVEPDTLIIALYGATAGKVALTAQKLTINQAICAIVPQADTFVSEYLFYYLQFIRDSILARRFGGAQPNLNQQIIRDLLLILPPLPEQKAIANVLSTIQKAIEAQDKIIAAARELKKSLMRHLFTYGPVPVAEAEKVPLKETEIGPVPEAWEVVKLEEISVKTKQVDPRREPSRSFRYVDVSSISRERLRIIDSTLYTGEDAPLRARKPVKSGDVIFATVRPYLKRVAVVPNELDGNVVSTAFCIIRTNKEMSEPDYVFYVLTKDDFVNRVSEHQRGSSYPAVTDKDILIQSIPLPPIGEQRDISKILSTVEKRIESEENRKIALQTLFKTMLHNLMTGKVRVNHLEATVS